MRWKKILFLYIFALDIKLMTPHIAS
jgi:hypothetical protein